MTKPVERRDIETVWQSYFDHVLKKHDMDTDTLTLCRSCFLAGVVGGTIIVREIAEEVSEEVTRITQADLAAYAD